MRLPWSLDASRVRRGSVHTSISPTRPDSDPLAEWPSPVPFQPKEHMKKRDEVIQASEWNYYLLKHNHPRGVQDPLNHVFPWLQAPKAGTRAVGSFRTLASQLLNKPSVLSQGRKA